MAFPLDHVRGLTLRCVLPATLSLVLGACSGIGPMYAPPISVDVPTAEDSAAHPGLTAVSISADNKIGETSWGNKACSAWPVDLEKNDAFATPFRKSAAKALGVIFGDLRTDEPAPRAVRKLQIDASVIEIQMDSFNAIYSPAPRLIEVKAIVLLKGSLLERDGASLAFSEKGTGISRREVPARQSDNCNDFLPSISAAVGDASSQALKRLLNALSRHMERK